MLAGLSVVAVEILRADTNRSVQTHHLITSAYRATRGTITFFKAAAALHAQKQVQYVEAPVTTPVVFRHCVTTTGGTNGKEAQTMHTTLLCTFVHLGNAAPTVSVGSTAQASVLLRATGRPLCVAAVKKACLKLLVQCTAKFVMIQIGLSCLGCL